MRRHSKRAKCWRGLAAALLFVVSCVAGAQEVRQVASTSKIALLLKLSGGVMRPVSLLFRSLSDERVVKFRESGPEVLRSINSGWGEQLIVFRIPPGEYVLDRWMADFEDEHGVRTAVSEPLGYRFTVADAESLIFGRLDLQTGSSASKGKLAYTLSHAPLTDDELGRIRYSVLGRAIFIAAQAPRQGRAAVTGTQWQ